jgi:hypothetical protein
VRNFRKRFGNRDSGTVKDEEDLGEVKLKRLNYQYMRQAVDEAVSTRAFRDGLVHRQLAHFTYKDGADMLTLAWVLFREEESELIDACGFGSLPFAREAADAFDIAVPKLTHRERLALDRLLPEGNMDELPGSITAEDAVAYSQLYRQMPIYVDAVI